MSVETAITILIVGMFLGFISGIFFFVKFLDQPETVNNNNIEKIKTVGRGNNVSIDREIVSFPPEEKKQKFNVLKRLKERREARKNQNKKEL